MSPAGCSWPSSSTIFTSIPGNGLPDGIGDDLGWLPGRYQTDRAGGLGDPEAVADFGDAQMLHDVVDEGRRKTGRSDRDASQGRQVEFTAAGAVDHGLEHGGRTGEERHPVVLDPLHDRVGVEHALRQDRHPPHERAQDAHVQPEGVEKRQHDQFPVSVAQVKDVGQVQVHVAHRLVLEHHALRYAGGARSEQDVAEVVALDRIGAPPAPPRSTWSARERKSANGTAAPSWSHGRPDRRSARDCRGRGGLRRTAT